MWTTVEQYNSDSLVTLDKQLTQKCSISRNRVWFGDNRLQVSYHEQLFGPSKAEFHIIGQ